MLLLILSCTEPPACPPLQVDHALDTAKSSVQLRCPGEPGVQMFTVSGGVRGERPNTRLLFCAVDPAAALPCEVSLPLHLDARLPLIYESWESPAQQPEEVQERDWKVQRGAAGWDVHGVEPIGQAEIVYSVHVEVPRTSPK